MPPWAVTAFVSITAIAAIPAPMVAGVLLDKISRPRLVLSPFIAATFLGTILIGDLTSTQSALAAAVLYGVALGSAPAMLAFLLARYFGADAQGQIFGTAILLIILGTGLGPVLMGVGYDATNSYGPGLIAGQLAAALAMLLALWLPDYRLAMSSSQHGP